MPKTLVIKDVNLHRELKRLSVDCDTPITELVETFIREGLRKRKRGAPGNRGRGKPKGDGQGSEDF